MELEQILSELENNTGQLPRLALQRAVEERQAITPLLLAALEEYKNKQDELLDKSDYILHIYALYLLAQFREKSAYPLIVEFFSAPGDISLDVTGDVVTEDLARILASVSDGNIEPIKQLIENQQVNQFVRGAAVDSLVVLVAQGIISREEVIQYFDELFSNVLEKKPDYIWTYLVVNSSRLCPIELKEHIKNVYEQHWIDTFFIQEEDVDDYLELGTEGALTELRKNPSYSLIEDTISEMQFWACFHQEKLKQNSNLSITDNISKMAEGFTHSFNRSRDPVKTKRKMQKESRRKNRKKKK